MAWAELRVATRISNGAPYPPATWWARHGIEDGDRMAPDQWQVRVDSAGERHYVRGTAVALGWLLARSTTPG